MIGLSPEQVDRQSLWQFAAAVEGYAAANGTSTLEPPSDNEYWEVVTGGEQ